MSAAPIQFAWQDPNKLLRQVRTLLETQNIRIKRVPELAIRNAAPELQSRIQMALPKKTSTLVRSVSVRFDRPTPSVLRARIGSHMVYAAYVEYGTGVFGPKAKPIVIVAKNRKALAWASRGKMVFRKRVTIQGMKPRPVYAQQTAAFMPRYTDIIRRELAKEGTA